MTVLGIKMKLRWLIRQLLPKFIACIIYRWRAGKYTNSLEVSIDPQKKTLIAFDHFYSQDLRALSIVNTEYNFVIIDSSVLFRGAKIHFRDDVRSMRVPYDSENIMNRRRWRRECRCLFKLLKERFGIDLIVVPADCYYWIREFIELAREHDVKTVVINKEGIISPQYFKAESARIGRNAPFISNHLYVWSERQRQYWNKAGVCDKEITVIGQPRSDLFHLEKHNEVDNLFPSVKPLVTFFSYMDCAYIPIELQEREGLTWKKMKEETHNAIYNLAQRYKEYNFVVKTHPQQPDRIALQAKYEMDNLRVIGGSSLGNELIRRSELIIAFQTTAIIEAMSLQKRILYTYWDVNLTRLENDLLPYHTSPGILVARSLSEFRKIVIRFLEGNAGQFECTSEEMQALREFVREYMYQPDGHVCERFYNSVRKFVR